MIGDYSSINDHLETARKLADTAETKADPAIYREAIDELVAAILSYAKSLASEMWINASAQAGDEELSLAKARAQLFDGVLWIEPLSQWTELRLLQWQGAKQTCSAQLCSDKLGLIPRFLHEIGHQRCSVHGVGQPFAGRRF